MSTEPRTPDNVDTVVVGAGFAGMYMLHRSRGLGQSAVVFEAGSDVGGTWYWNRYPGARCDVESMEYSYSFDHDLQQEWEWSERYAAQPEILRYAGHVADRFDLRRDIRFDTRVVGATFDETASRWTVRTDRGDVVSAQFLVMATGCLSSANRPQFEGADTFTGATYHTGEWPHEGVDFTGKRVGVIGTGSSAVQSIPVMAQQAAHLTVFQRTATYTVPARNQPLDPQEQAAVKARYDELRAANLTMSGAFGSRTVRGVGSAKLAPADERELDLAQRWEHGGFGFLAGYEDFLLDRDSNEVAAEFVRSRIRDIVEDPDTARKLMPTQVIGCKRLVLDTNYFETFNRPNVSLVDVSAAPIERITADGIITDGVEYPLDVIVFATGFDAMTGTLLKMDIVGRDGTTLRDAWAAGPRTYLGLGVAGFPNLFTISGPGSPSVLTNMIISIQQHVEWIAQCMDDLRAKDLQRIEATTEAQDAWVDHVNAVAGMTLFPSCNSWYLGANVPGKTRVFMPLLGFPPYAEKCAAVAAADYEGFALS